MKLNISAVSNVGCVRPQNEDMILIGNRFIRDDEYSEEVNLDQRDRFLMALADGMGGHNSGDVASKDVLENLQFFFNDLPSTLSVNDFNEAIFEWLDSINSIIEAKGNSSPQYFNMGTTLVTLTYYAGEFYWMNCGDSRVYRFHDHQLCQLSTDHSLSNLMGETGHSNVITNCIGGGSKTSYIDMVNCTGHVESGDFYLLCSDGLTDMITDEELETLLNDGANAAHLCQAAIDAGGFDNVSACLIKIV